MAQDDIFRLSIEGLGPSGQELVNVFHYRQTSAVFGDDNGEDLIDAWIEDVSAAWAACVSSSCSLTKLEARNLTQPLLGFDFSPSPAIAGTLAGDALPPTAPPIITWRTGLIGRSRRGRTYMWPPNEAQQIGGQIQGGFSTLLNAFATAANQITDSVVGATYQMVVWSPTLLEANAVTTWTVQEFLGRMGSRRAGVGS